MPSEPSYRIRMIETDADLRRCFPVMVQLRTHLSEEGFAAQVERQAGQGYQVAALEQGSEVRAVAGFRVTETLFSGKHLYVDDLVSDADSRSSGFGSALLTWLADHARSAGCRSLELDSGVQRADAHRFYHREGMHIASFHFRKKMEE